MTDLTRSSTVTNSH